MNINMQGLNLLNRPMSKATQDRMERQAKRDNQIAFFEKQKENLKNMKTNSLEDIQRKLDMFQQYNDQIDADSSYATIYMTLNEVKEYTKPVITPEEEKLITFRDHEVSSVKWYSKEELKKLISEGKEKITGASVQSFNILVKDNCI